MKSFIEFPKMARLSRDIIITEKIDGTNASIDIVHRDSDQDAYDDVNSQVPDKTIIATVDEYNIRAGSRTRWVVPGDDNHGWAKWVYDNRFELVKLGEGTHFGEWWGSGIQRGYGLSKGEKRFSLFNTYRWRDGGKDIRPACCHVVPILYEGAFDMQAVYLALEFLKTLGSKAAPGYMYPEGIIVWHTAANIGFKKTILKDESPKSLVKE